MNEFPTYREKNLKWKQTLRGLREKVTTRRGIMLTLTMLREQISQVSREDWHTRQVLDETIKYFEGKLHETPKGSAADSDA